MLERYRPAVSSFDEGVVRAITARFSLRSTLDLFDGLHVAGLSQADLCLELLRLELIPEVEVLVGRPITRCAGFRYVVPLPRRPDRPPSADDRLVRSVVRNPRLPTTPSFQRFQEFRVGVSVRSLLQRGVTRRDLREALRGDKQGPWVTLS